MACVYVLGSADKVVSTIWPGVELKTESMGENNGTMDSLEAGHNIPYRLGATHREMRTHRVSVTVPHRYA